MHLVAVVLVSGSPSQGKDLFKFEKKSAKKETRRS